LRRYNKDEADKAGAGTTGGTDATETEAEAGAGAEGGAGLSRAGSDEVGWSTLKRSNPFFHSAYI